MAYQNNLLFRTFLGDTGKEHRNATCSSPDIITHEQVLTPANFFAGNYTSDPNQQANKLKKTNLIYTRVKNHKALEEPVVGYIRLYKSWSSLFLNPDNWVKNKLFTPQGKAYTRVETHLGANIAVGDDVFVIDGTTASSFCLLGIVNTDQEETIPTVSNYTDYIEWIHSNPAVCARNLSVISSGTKSELEELYHFSNPENHDIPVTFVLTTTNLPQNTLIGLKCEPLKMTEEKKVNATECQVELKIEIPAGFNGYINVYATLPGGAVWPENATVNVSTHLDATPADRIFCYGVSPKLVLKNSQLLSAYNSNHRLVLLGNCGVVFK